MKDDIVVSVICVAYNHENFIRDCIEGVIKQKTNFKVELIIHDDASTDETANIIREYENKYPDRIVPVYQKENQFYHRSILMIMLPKVRGKYIAFCDGDDYWIAEDKLQKQVDFLESHQEYSMCMHNAVRVNYETGEEKVLNTFPQEGTYPQEQQVMAGLGSDFPAWASVMVRADLLRNIPDFFLKPKVQDYPLRQYYASQGKVYYFAEPMSVYRVATPGSYMRNTAKKEAFYNNYTLEMLEFFEKFDQYTGGRFHSILECKLLSDYFGFCLSIEEAEGMRKASECALDMEKIEKIYQCLSTENINSDILRIYEKSDALFIYGISRIAPICKRQLEHAGIAFEGFVVSDSQMKADGIEGKQVYYLSEVAAKYKNPGFVLAVQPINVGMITEMLRNHGMDNYCAPYTI